MKRAQGYELPDDQMPHLRRAIRLEIITFVYMVSSVALMGLMMGNSQAMRTAWIEDMLVLIPPIAFLIATRLRKRKPTEEFPYGYHRAVSIAFLTSAVALAGFGLLLLYEAISKLIHGQHPTIGSMEVFGTLIWQGWLMLPVLAYSTIGPMILGRLMIQPADQLHDKVLYATSQMLKADWLTAVAAAAGVLGIGIGWWWVDAVAAMVISVDILYDGWRSLKAVIGDLMDRTPETADLNKRDPLVAQLNQRLRQLPWVRDVDLRMRESGHVLFGDVFIVPVDESDPIDRAAEAIRAGQAIHWRIHTLTVELVDDLHDPDPPSEEPQ